VAVVAVVAMDRWGMEGSATDRNKDMVAVGDLSVEIDVLGKSLIPTIVGGRRRAGFREMYISLKPALFCVRKC
jgi:hypothetical protein